MPLTRISTPGEGKGELCAMPVFARRHRPSCGDEGRPCGRAGYSLKLGPAQCLGLGVAGTGVPHVSFTPHPVGVSPDMWILI
jgi:hypothetical protein